MTTSHGDGDQEIYGDYSVDDEDQPSNLEDLGVGDVVGIDGAGASAEEAAMHVVEDFPDA